MDPGVPRPQTCTLQTPSHIHWFRIFGVSWGIHVVTSPPDDDSCSPKCETHWKVNDKTEKKTRKEVPKGKAWKGEMASTKSTGKSGKRDKRKPKKCFPDTRKEKLRTWVCVIVSLASHMLSRKRKKRSLVRFVMRKYFMTRTLYWFQDYHYTCSADEKTGHKIKWRLPCLPFLL